jgi:hypothetical protein
MEGILNKCDTLRGKPICLKREATINILHEMLNILSALHLRALELDLTRLHVLCMCHYTVAVLLKVVFLCRREDLRSFTIRTKVVLNKFSHLDNLMFYS